MVRMAAFDYTVSRRRFIEAMGLVAGAGVFDHDLGGVFWKIDLCVLCGFVVFAVQRAGDGLAGTELVCVGIFCGGDFLFCAV